MKTNKIITASGFECEINNEALNDMEVLDLLIEMDEDNSDIVTMQRLANKVLGEDTRKRLYEHIRLESGRVPTDKFILEFYDIFNKLNEVKKS